MTPTEVKQAADEMVERYLRLHWRMTNEAATRCAIRSCEDTIGVLLKFKDRVFKESPVDKEIAEQKKIIEYLKTKL